MKKKLLCLSLVALCLTGCADNSKVDDILGEFENEKLDLGISNEWDGVNFDDDGNGYAETSEGFYYFDSANTNMKYISKKAESVITLCTKIECDHQLGDEIGNVAPEEVDSYISDCEAIYYRNSGHQMYNGKLYADVVYHTDDVQFHPLLSVSLDGTQREKVIEDISIRVNAEEDKAIESVGRLEVAANSINWFIRGDKVYVVSEIQVRTSGAASAAKERVYIDVYDLNTGKLSEELYYNQYDAYDFFPQYLYVDDESVTLISMASFTGDEQCQHILRVDVQTGEQHDFRFAEPKIGYYYMEDKMIFGKVGGDVYTIDAYGNEEKIIELTETEREKGMYYREMGDYVMTMSREKVDIGDGTMGYYVKIYDKEYKYLDTVYFTEYIWPVGGGHDVILFGPRGDSGSYYSINTADIGSGDIKLNEYKNK